MSSYYGFQTQGANYAASGTLSVGGASGSTSNAAFVGTGTTSAAYALYAGGQGQAYVRLHNDGRLEWNFPTGQSLNLHGASPDFNHSGTGTCTWVNGSASDKGYIQFPAADTGTINFNHGLATPTVSAFSFNAAVSKQRYVLAKTANYTVTLGDTGTVFTNTGAVGAVQFTLPAPNISLMYTFVCTAAQTITVTEPSSQIVGAGSLSGITRTLTGGTGAIQYTSMTIIANDHDGYYIVDGYGTIT